METEWDYSGKKERMNRKSKQVKRMSKGKWKKSKEQKMRK